MNSMIGRSLYTRQQHQGFTIVELIVIIIVIAILATITIVSYNAITQNVREQTVTNDLQKAMTAINKFKTETGVYPSVLTQLSSFTPADGITYVYNYTATDDSFCIEADDGAEVLVHVESGSREPKAGGCSVSFDS